MQVFAKLCILVLATLEVIQLVSGQWPGYGMMAGAIFLVGGGVILLGGK